MNQAERRVWLINALLMSDRMDATLPFLPEPTSSVICSEPL